MLTVLLTIGAVLGPLFYNSFAERRATVCEDNLRQMSVLLMMYVVDHSAGQIPAYEDGWVRKLSSMSEAGPVDQTAAPKGIWRCPSQSYVSLGEGATAEQWWHGSNYGINQHIASNLLDSTTGKPYAEWAQASIRNFALQTDANPNSPGSKVVIADTSGSNFYGRLDLDPTIAGISKSGVTYAEATGRNPASPFPYLRHIGSTGNFLFLDSHVERLSSFPALTLGPWTRGYQFWHAEHAYPGSGVVEAEATGMNTPSAARRRAERAGAAKDSANNLAP